MIRTLTSVSHLCRKISTVHRSRPAKMSLKGAYWREATTLILAAKRAGNVHGNPPLEAHPGNSYGADYRVLMMTRSRRSAFLSERVVFPGGVLDDEDFSETWRKVFEEYASTSFSELESAFKVNGQRSPIILASRGNVSRPYLPADFAVRIAAIRETFEETGILLVRSKSEPLSSARNVEGPTKMHRVPKSTGLRKWRERVRKDPRCFQELCLELDVVPNVWALKEWSNWLTPSTQTETEGPPVKPHRFDTLFYLCCLDEIPRANADKMEVYSTRWASPGELLHLSKQDSAGGIKLIDPQIYELSRLRQFNKLSELCVYATERQKLGSQRMLTALVACSDGIINAITGDDFHPEEMDPEKATLVHCSKTMEESRKESTFLNRIEWPAGTSGAVRMEHGYKVVCNITLDGHVAPYVEDDCQPTAPPPPPSNL